MPEFFSGRIVGKRKFTVALLALSMSFVALMLGKVSGGEWVMVVTAIVGLYSWANVKGKESSDG